MISSGNPYHQGNPILELTFEFSIELMEYVALLEDKRKFVFANQLLKSGTSIGANSREAQNAESKNDFIHKMKIAAKEGNETEYWLLLCQKSPHYPNPEGLLEKLTSINKMLNKIIASSKKNR